MRTGPRVTELVTLEITDLKPNESNGYFKNCKKKSDGWFSLHPKFSDTLWKFIEEDISGSNYVFHNRYEKNHLATRTVERLVEKFDNDPDII